VCGEKKTPFSTQFAIIVANLIISSFVV